jgi:hypothetical protein
MNGEINLIFPLLVELSVILLAVALLRISTPYPEILNSWE